MTGESVQLVREGEQGDGAAGTGGTRPQQPQGEATDPTQTLDGTHTSAQQRDPEEKIVGGCTLSHRTEY